MKNFDWEKFKNKYEYVVVHCKTEWEAKDFCKRMFSEGMIWATGKSYDKYTEWYKYRERTCYTSDGTIDTIEYCKKDEGCEIIEWTEYMNKEFKKSDLRDGMIVEEKNGTRRVVLNDVLMGIDDFNLIDYIREDLTDMVNKENDIVKVYTIKKGSKCDLTSLLKKTFFNALLELVWERKEV